MTTWLREVIASVTAVRREKQVWVQHLTGEGPATLRRQRDAVVQALDVPASAELASPSSVRKAASRLQGSSVVALLMQGGGA